jgi:hypothetical protein
MYVSWQRREWRGETVRHAVNVFQIESAALGATAVSEEPDDKSAQLILVGVFVKLADSTGSAIGIIVTTTTLSEIVPSSSTGMQSAHYFMPWHQILGSAGVKCLEIFRFLYILTLGTST